jgi:hypothetical protein
MSLPENSNPYEAPRADLRAVGVRSGQQADVRQVAVAQKVILVCILIQIVNMIFQLTVALGKLPIPQEALMAASIVSLITSVVSAVYVFILAIRVYNTGLGILFGILALVPCAGLVVLLVVNAKATGILQANGHKVGLMGADLSTIPVS